MNLQLDFQKEKADE